VTDPLATSDPRIVLRFASEGDIGLIIDFIRQLAEFVKLSDEVVADENQLRGTLFGERQVAEVVIASHDGEAAGFALFFHSYSTFLGQPGIYLEDLFVVPRLRGHGIGRILLACLAKLAVQRGCGRLEWAVIDWNEPAIRFYKRLSAQALDDRRTYRLSGDALEDLAEGRG
jgi:GNAT superfamily N-acetyltransferase